MMESCEITASVFFVRSGNSESKVSMVDGCILKWSISLAATNIRDFFRLLRKRPILGREYPIFSSQLDSSRIVNSEIRSILKL